MIRDRIKDLRRVRAGDLRPSPSNWRTHPESQRMAPEGVLSEIGYADALLARELPDGSLEIVDGHLRQSLDPDQEVPVLILDLDEAEAAKLLTVLDPIAGMAEADEEALGKLLAETNPEARAMIHTNNAPGYTPNPEQIAALCKDIQRGWNRQTELARRVTKQKPYKLRVTPASVFPLNRDAEVRVI